MGYTRIVFTILSFIARNYLLNNSVTTALYIYMRALAPLLIIATGAEKGEHCIIQIVHSNIA